MIRFSIFCSSITARSRGSVLFSSHITAFKQACKSMYSLSDDNQADIIEAFNTTFKYLDDLLNFDNPSFERMVNQICPPQLQLNKANTSHTGAPFLDYHLSISNGFDSSKVYDKRDDFDFDIVKFPSLDCDVPRRPSYGVYISQLRFARVFSHVGYLVM